MPFFLYSNTFHILRPTKAPGFVYAWLELISHRIFIARMLAHTPQQKVHVCLIIMYMTVNLPHLMSLTDLLMSFLSWQGWPMYAQLLIDLFKYLAPFLRNVELNKPMQILYKVSPPHQACL